MYVVVAFAIGFVILRFLWPRLLEFQIQRGRPAESLSNALVILFAVFVVALWAVFVTSSGERGWTENEPALVAFAVVAGLFWGYGHLYPPSFYAGFLPVRDTERGTIESQVTNKIMLRRDEVEPVCIAVYNTGITALDNYRITVFVPGNEANPGETQLFRLDEILPSNVQWDWMPKSITINPHGASLQTERSMAIVIGEPQLIRFFVKTAKPPGVYPVIISVAAGNRLGETRRKLNFTVTD